MKKSNKYITAKREINKKILKNTVQGFLKTTLSLLPVALSLSALSTGIVFSVKEGKAEDAIKDYPKSDQFIVTQSNDLMELDEKFNAGEIEPAEYLKGLQYLKSEEYFSEVMNKDHISRSASSSSVRPTISNIAKESKFILKSWH